MVDRQFTAFLQTVKLYLFIKQAFTCHDINSKAITDF